METPPPATSSHVVDGHEGLGDDRHSLTHLLGGPREALEGAAPSVTFVVAYAVAGTTLTRSLLLALAVAAALAVVRLARRESLRHILGGLAAVAFAAAVAAGTGRAEGYFLPSLPANLAAALIWAVSILAGWPLLGVIVGAAVGQRTRWRSDPELVCAYGRASWIWVASFVVRAEVMTPLYLYGDVLALGAGKVVLGWPMVLIVIWLSWVTIGRTLPVGHPGLSAAPRGEPRPTVG